MPTPFEDVPRHQKIDATPKIGEETGRPPNDTFKNMMQSPSTAQIPGAPGSPSSPSISPFDLAGATPPLGAGPTMQSLLTQVSQAHTTLGDISNFLSTPNLRLKQSHKYLLKNKLSGAVAHLRSANSKLDVDPLPQEPEADTSGGPIGKFLGMVTDGQNQLQAAQHQLESLNKSGTSVNPAQLLLVQLKLNKAQTLLEYSSVMLSNAVSDVKMLFGIQL